MNSVKGYPSRWRVIVFSTILAGTVACTSWAQVTNLSGGGSINFSALNNTTESVLIGDKLFSNFSFQYVDTDGNMGDDLSASALVLSALSNQVGFGISVQLPLVATGPTIKDITLQFSATVTNSDNKISDVHLDFTGSASGNGLAEVSESIFTNGFGVGNLANLGLSKNAGGFIPPNGEDTAIFSIPQSKIWVEKDIFVSGNPDSLPPTPNDFASITIVNQTFSQIPEPSSIMLALAGMVAFLFVRRRK